MLGETLDVRVIPPPQKHTTIFSRYFALEAGQSFTLVNDHDPKPLYYQFTAEYAGRFEWEYLEHGPGRLSRAHRKAEELTMGGSPRVHATREKLLDARPILAKGGDPFRVIVRRVGELAADEALHLVVGFEPVPLYSVLGRARASPRTSRRTAMCSTSGSGAARRRRGLGARRLQEPVELDVRGLEPPQPMIAILEKLVELGDGAQLLVRHHREPVLLYEKLAARGYAAKTSRRGEGDYLVHIAPTGPSGTEPA